MAETVLIVDDEEPVRRTFRDWLDQSGFGCQVLVASDAESALVLANQHAIDLAVLDWNLGAGSDGLQLLEDLAVFHPEIVAILATGFANQATPLDAMRKGVRDYLDKNQDLNRATFLNAVRKQLDRIIPSKRERRFHQVLVNFREAVEKVLPLVRSATAMQDPVPLPDAVSRLLRFVIKATNAADGVLLMRAYDPDKQPSENLRVYDSSGKLMTITPVPFARSLAGIVAGMGEPAITNDLDQAGGSFDLQPFERGVQSLLAAPLNVCPSVQVVLELLDKQPGSGPTFEAQDQATAAAAADLGSEMLRQALAERQMHQVLFDAVGVALSASASLVEKGTASPGLEQPPSDQILDQLRKGLGESPTAVAAEETLKLAEAVRVLALRHGPPAVQHLIRQAEDLQRLLNDVTGM